MRIHVLGEDAISPQARTYAEYRVFAALTQLAEREQVRHARVVLRSASRSGACEAVTCTVTVALDGQNSMRVRARGDHAYAAINRAVERIRAVSAPNHLELADAESVSTGTS